MMTNGLKIKLLVYAILSAVSFTTLITVDMPGISVLIFILLQAIFCFFVIRDRKKLWAFVPMFLISLNFLLSASYIFWFTNFLSFVLLYGLLVCDLNLFDKSNQFFGQLFFNVFKSIGKITVPLKWLGEIRKGKTTVFVRIVTGLLIAAPCMIFLFFMLSSADTVFGTFTEQFIEHILTFIDQENFIKALVGIMAGLTMFGIAYRSHTQTIVKKTWVSKPSKGDLLVFNIVLISLLFIYTIFVVIQFRYLFAQASLPYGLSFSEYARKGFFELLFLSGVNILLILIATHLSSERNIKLAKLTKVLSCYLCFVTMVLLASSFYRMYLYNGDGGLTRLRFFVFGFLFFEAVGLIATVWYVFKPNFNVLKLYFLLALSYYVVLNLLPTDYIVAKNQVDRYLASEGIEENDDPYGGISYIVTLSPDAAPQIKRLYSEGKQDTEVIKMADEYFDQIKDSYEDDSSQWQGYNLSISRAMSEMK